MDQEKKTEQFVKLITAHHDQLYRYVFALVSNADDARDVLQEACVALFQKFDQFDSARPFLPWAYKFAYLHVLKWRERSARQMPTLSGDVLELLARERQTQESVLEQRLAAFDGCMERLPERDRKAIRCRYFEGLSAEEIAMKLGTSRRTLFREFQRIRRVLMDCIDQKIAGEEI